MKKIQEFSKKINFLLLFIFLLGLFIRLLGTKPGYPLTHPDEPKITYEVEKIVLLGDFAPFSYWYGSLLPLIYSIFTVLIFIPINFGSFAVSNSSFNTERWLYSMKLNHDLHYWVRQETAFLSSLTILAIYYLAKKLFNKTIALLVAFLTAVNYRHVVSSSFALGDAPQAFFIVLSIILSIRIITNPSYKNYILAGLGISLTSSVKYFIYPVLTLFLSHVVSLQRRSEKFRFLIDYRILLCGLVALGVFLLINPFFLTDTANAIDQLNYNRTKYFPSFNDFLNIFKGDFIFFPLYYLLKFGNGLTSSLLIILGLIPSLYYFRRSSLVVLSALLPYLLILISSGTPNVRLYSPIIPLMLIYSAIFLWTIKVKVKTFGPLLFVLILMLVSFSSLKNSISHAHSFSLENNNKQLSDWLYANLVERAPNKIASNLGVFFPPVLMSEIIQSDPSSETLMATEELIASDIRWVVFNSESFAQKNGLFFINKLWNEVSIRSILNDSEPWSTLNNTYASLVLQELNNYKVNEFSKNTILSLDPKYLLINLPEELTLNNLTKTDFYSFEKLNKKPWNILQTYQSDACFVGHKAFLEPDGIDGVVIALDQNKSPRDCKAIIVNLSMAQLFLAEENKLYLVKLDAKYDTRPASALKRDGFLRLDFLSDEEIILKSYVSRLLSSNNGWETLNAIGVSPPGAKHYRISFQTETCCKENEAFFLKTLKFFNPQQPNFSTRDYKYFNSSVNRSFIWSLPL